MYTLAIGEDFLYYSEKCRKFFVSKKYVLDIISSYIKVGAFDGEQLMGFIIAYKPYGGVVEVRWLIVSKKYRNKGVGARLLQALEDKALGLGVHNIHVETNENVVGYYKRNGYEILGFDKEGYFGSDNYYMKKLIQEPQENVFLK